MADNLIKIVPLEPFITDEYHADGSREYGDAWLCVDKRHFMDKQNHSGNFVNIKLNDHSAAMLLVQLSRYFEKRTR